MSIEICMYVNVPLKAVVGGKKRWTGMREARAKAKHETGERRVVRGNDDAVEWMADESVDHDEKKRFKWKGE